MKKQAWRRWAPWVLGAAAVLAAAMVWTQRPRAVETLEVTRGTLVQSVVTSGRVATPARIELGADVSAVVRTVEVEEGQTVRRGERLITLADGEAQAALVQAQAAVAEAQARLAQLERLTAPAAQASLRQAQAAQQTATRELERVKALVAQGFFSRQRLDEAERALVAADSALESARLQVQATSGNGVEMQLARTRLEQAQAARATAQARLDRLELRAPDDAVVLLRQAEPGMAAQPGRALLVLARSGKTRIESTVDERQLALLRVGQAARVRADAYPDQAFDARLDWIAPSVDALRGTVALHFTVEQPPAFLRPDMTVSVDLEAGRRSEAVLVGAEAIRGLDGSEPWVLKVSEGRLLKQPVRLGLRGAGQLEVLEGLAAGDRVLPATVTGMAAGDRVRAEP